MATKLFVRHVNRGWDRATMKHWIISADIKIQQDPLQQTQPTHVITEEPLTNKERVFLHFEYHKNDIPKIKYGQSTKQRAKSYYHHAWE